jgi:hypothetical protein
MFARSILVPSLIACAIAAPILISKAKKTQPTANQSNSQFQNPNNPNYGDGNNWNPNFNSGMSNNRFVNSPQIAEASSQNAPTGNPIFHQANANNVYAPINPAASQANNRSAFQMPNFGQPVSGVRTQAMPVGFPQANLSGMTPDYGAVETVILPGNAMGPDLNAAPLEFMPVTNFEEIFRFNVQPNWVKQRWKRVSTNPGDRGLHGLRVALVTGTNSWDLHGSLTYYFDGNQQTQRITFRGWAGDASKLVNLLTQRYGFRPQPTHWAGFYLAESKRKPTGAILMQHPTVIYTENPVQQVAVVMEMNNPQSKFELSDDFRSLIIGSQQSQ